MANTCPYMHTECSQDDSHSDSCISTHGEVNVDSIVSIFACRSHLISQHVSSGNPRNLLYAFVIPCGSFCVAKYHWWSSAGHIARAKATKRTFGRVASQTLLSSSSESPLLNILHFYLDKQILFSSSSESPILYILPFHLNKLISLSSC